MAIENVARLLHSLEVVAVLLCGLSGVEPLFPVPVTSTGGLYPPVYLIGLKFERGIARRKRHGD